MKVKVGEWCNLSTETKQYILSRISVAKKSK